jgi:predicted lipid-binding transport protein (Tim44 family)
MKSFIVALTVALVAATSMPSDAFARRLGGGGMSGMQRSLPPRAAPQAVPAKPTTPAAQPTTPATAAAPAVAPKRSWLGPIAGLAAGLGIAALMSHLGFGAGFGNIVMLLLLAVVAIAVIRLVMRRFAPTSATQGMQLAGAGAPFPDATATPPPFGGAAAAASPMALSDTLHVPAGFDVAGFERIAKMIFIRMQTANDAGDLNDLRNFTTPEMFAAARLDLQDRGATVQRTDVVRVDAEVLDVASEAERQIVSVRFHGLIREEIDGVAEPFDEIWHLVKPADGSREWAIAGIQPSESRLARAA